MSSHYGYIAFIEDREASAGVSIVFCLKTGGQINIIDPKEIDGAVKYFASIKKQLKGVVHTEISKEIVAWVWLDDGEKIPNQCIGDLCNIWMKCSSLAEQMWNILIKYYQGMGEWGSKIQKISDADA